MTKTAAQPLDDFDKAILRIVQRDNQLSHAAIGEAVNLSSSAVRRRLTRMRSDGTIARDVAILDPGRDSVTFLVSVKFSVDTAESYAAFDAFALADPHIKQCYHVSGSNDYALVVEGPSLGWFEDWAKATMMSNPALQRHDTAVVYSCKKFETAREL